MSIFYDPERDFQTDWRACPWCGATTRHDRDATNHLRCYRDVRHPRAARLSAALRDGTMQGIQHAPGDPLWRDREHAGVER